MLNSLSIKNFALIEDVELALENNFTTITGETGAGKSILLGALSLLLGKRADIKNVRNPKKKCVIEGVFSIASYRLRPLFEANNLDYDPESIIRREILPSGKSRAFINDTPVNLKQMSALGEHLVDIHSQHEILFVGDALYQYEVIDALADNAQLFKEYSESLKEYNQLKEKLKTLVLQQQEAQKTYDYHLFLLNELRESQLEEGMQEKLEERSEQLSNVEELKEKLSSSIQELQQEDLGITDSLTEINSRLASLEHYGESYRELSARMNSVLLEVEDMTTEMEGLFESVEDDPKTLETINEKLHILYSLQKKHGLTSVAELMELQKELDEKVTTSENADQDKAHIEKAIKASKAKTNSLAQKLTENRIKAVPRFIKAVKVQLSKLGMADAQLKIEIDKSSEFSTRGKDNMQWLFSANQGGNFRPIKKSASGGELSRIALVIKSILAKFSSLPTLIFDEIDTGVSGDIAQKMGDIMDEMGKHLQIISITHLPQIAAKGSHHFKVFKEVRQGKTQTIIKDLKTAQRIEELAEMLGGKEKLDSAIAHAKALLK